MATFTSNFALTKPDYGEAADIAVINGNTDEIDEIMHDNRYMMADAWSSSVSYAVGDLCIYENALYKCVTATSGNWDASCWEVTTLAENIGSVTVSKTATGNPIELTDAASAPMVSCVTEIQGTQDLHGYSKPWVGGANVNKLDPSTLNPGYILSSGAIATPTNTKEYYSPILDIGSATLITVGYNAYASGETVWLGIGWYQSDDTFINREVSYSAYKTFTVPENASKVMVSMRTFDHGLDYCFLALSDTTTFSPYANICPITAYTEGEVVVSDEDSNTTTHTTTYPTAIYRGSEDVTEGEVSCDKEVYTISGGMVLYGNYGDDNAPLFYYDTDNDNIAVYNNTTAPDANKLLSNFYTANSANTNSGMLDFEFRTGSGTTSDRFYFRDSRFTTAEDYNTWLANNPLQIVYTLATPTTSTVTVSNAPIRTISGYNHIESSTGDLEVEYITQTYEPIVKALEH